MWSAYHGMDPTAVIAPETTSIKISRNYIPVTQLLSKTWTSACSGQLYHSGIILDKRGDTKSSNKENEPYDTEYASLTHSCLEINLSSLVWTCHTSKDNFAMKHKSEKYLIKSCRWSYGEQLSIKYLILSCILILLLC